MVQREKRLFDRGAKRFLFWLVCIVMFFFLLHIFKKWNNRKFNNRDGEQKKDIIVQSSHEEFEDKDTLCISHNGSLWKDFGMSEAKSLSFAREVGLKHWYDEKSRLIVLVHEGDCYTIGWKKIPKN
jgi:hypothetical protein